MLTKLVSLTVSAGLILNLMGCATIVNGTEQAIDFQPRPVSLQGAMVKYESDESEGETRLPSQRTVARSEKPMALTFHYTDPSGQARTLQTTAPSLESSWIWGNLGIAIASLGIGFISFLIDAGTNASREYPAEITLDAQRGFVLLKYPHEKDKYYRFDQSTQELIEVDASGQPLPEK